ncbi:MAG: sulfotransferase [Planctomycetota bacterium]|nr:sulfotransferase [Planctomycetota bacterium]
MNAPADLLAEAHRFIQAGDLNLAEQRLQQVIAADKSQSEAWNLLGWIQSQQKNFTAAVESIGRAIGIHPNEPSLHRNLGFVHQSAGELSQAAACFERAIQLAPDDGNAHNELGVVLRAKQEYEAAANHLHEAIRLQPKVPLYRQNLAEVLGSIKQFDEAVRQYKEAIAMAPADAGLLNGLGVMLQESGQHDEAIDCFRQALVAAPNHPLYENNLASALQSIGEDEQAIVHYENLLRTMPESSDTHVNIGNFHLARNALEQAAHHFGCAIQIEPDHCVAHNNLGSTLLDQGNFSEAAVHFEKSLESNPEYAPAYFNLSDLALSNKFRFTDEQILKIQKLVSGGNLPPESASAMLFAVGNHFDSRDNYAEAFKAYQVANDIQSQINQAKNRSLDLEARESLTETIIQFFNKDYFDNLPGCGSASEIPIFVVGMPRSGSTLIEQIISSHPAAVAAGELEEIGRLATKILPRRMNNDKDFPLCLQGFEQSIISELAEEYLDFLRNNDAVAPHWDQLSRVVDKMWHNFLHLGFLYTLFPQARIIHSRRNAMDIGLSCFMRRLHAVNWSWDLEQIGIFYRLYDQLMQHWREVLPSPFYEIEYETLTQDPETETRKLIEFCGLPWDERCLAFYENETAVRTASRIQVREPIYQSSAGRWKNYATELAPLKAAIESV